MSAGSLTNEALEAHMNGRHEDVRYFAPTCQLCADLLERSPELFPEPESSVKPRSWVDGAAELKLELTDRPTTWDEQAEHTERILRVATATAGENASRWVLFSGGNDSLVLLHFLAFTMGVRFDGVLHVNTGTGVIDDDGRQVTTEFAREIVAEWGLPFVEIHPPEPFEQVFIEDPIINGLPGPGLHHIARTRLKDRAIAAYVQSVKRGYWDRVQLWTGIRWAESNKRMGYAEKVVNRERAQVWSNPIYYATHQMMAEYRGKHGLPQNPAAEHIHMSGECLCGSYASPGELEEIRFFFPATAARIEGWEARCRERGLRYARWGHRRTAAEIREAASALGYEQLTLDDLSAGGLMCSGCETRAEASR